MGARSGARCFAKAIFVGWYTSREWEITRIKAGARTHNLRQSAVNSRLGAEPNKFDTVPTSPVTASMRRLVHFGFILNTIRSGAFKQTSLVHPSEDYSPLEIIRPSVRPVEHATREPRMDPQSTVFPAQPCRP